MRCYNGWALIIRNDSAATVAADVWASILNLNSSKWQQALIDKGLATYLNFSYQSAKYVGPINLFAVPNPAKLKEFNTELMNQIGMMADENYFTEEQLATAKANLLRNKIRQTEKPSNLPSNITYWWCSFSLDYFNDYDANMQKVTRKEISDFVKKYIKDKPYVAGMIINEEMSKELKPAEFFTNLKSF